MSDITEQWQVVKVFDRVSCFKWLSLSGFSSGPISLIYTSSHPNAVKYCKAQFFTDDFQIYYSFPVAERALVLERINEDLIKLRDVFRCHSLILSGRRVDKDKLSNYIT